MKALNKADDSKDDTASNIINNSTSSSWNKDLTSLLQDFFISIYLDSIDNMVSQIDVSFGSDDVFHSMAEEYASQRTADLLGKRVKSDGSIVDNPNPEYSIEQSTKDMLKSDLENYMKEGLTPAEIAKKLQDDYAFSEKRAMTIARTETGFAWNHAGISTIQAGGAKGVKVFDGDHDGACAEANGQNWTFDYALEHLLQHPNCVRSFGIMSSDEDFDMGAEDLEDETLDQAASAVD